METVTKQHLAKIRPTVSSARMRHLSDVSDKTYQGHLTYVAAIDRWIGWVEYGKTGAKQQRSPVTASPTSVDAAMRAVNVKMYEKQHRNRDLYSPIDGSPSGQIDGREAVEAVRLMQAAARLSA